MLPYTPLQHLLLAAAASHDMHALVMTSGNLSEEPIESDDGLAWEHLVAPGIADALLGNDRAILSRYDDSVVRVVDGTVIPVRRARGYAPQPLSLPALNGTAPCVLACGPQQRQRSHSHARMRTARRPVLCRSILAMLKTARPSMLERRTHTLGRSL
ncbi:MAG: Sua5/YciO/YrdC/YwlC family protein [Collinsella sp.]